MATPILVAGAAGRVMIGIAHAREEVVLDMRRAALLR